MTLHHMAASYRCRSIRNATSVYRHATFLLSARANGISF